MGKFVTVRSHHDQAELLYMSDTANKQ